MASPDQLSPNKERADATRHEGVILGVRHIWGGEQPLRLSAVDRRQHTYVIGQTGTGKSTLLANLICQDIAAGRGVGLIDPHGDLAREVLDHIPPWRTDDVVYFNPADRDYPIGFNLLQDVPVGHRPRVASGIVAALKSVWRDSWGPRLEYILYASVAALLDCRNTSLLGVQRMLVDDYYRQWVVRQVRDPMVRSFWLDEFDGVDHRTRREWIAPIQNKVGQLLMAAPVRNVLGQVKRKFDPRFTMDHHRIFIANLSKGLLGEYKANLLGSMLLTIFQLAAMERADVPEDDREDFALYIDEFHNFTTDSFASILSEGRKYRLGLVLAHQYVEQLRQGLPEAIFGNVGTLVAFRVGEQDAPVLARAFGGGNAPEQFSALSNHEVRVKLLSGGGYADPFHARTLPPSSTRYDRAENLIRRSRKRYALPRRIVEDKIRRWMGDGR
jgi:hypothetical protein